MNAEEEGGGKDYLQLTFQDRFHMGVTVTVEVIKACMTFFNYFDKKYHVTLVITHILMSLIEIKVEHYWVEILVLIQVTFSNSYWGFVNCFLVKFQMYLKCRK